MSESKGSGGTAAKCLGVMVCFYGFIMVVASFFSEGPGDVATYALMGLGVAACVVGAGLVNLNYHAWFTAVVLLFVVVFVDIISLYPDPVLDSEFFLKFFKGLFWLSLLYTSKDAVQEKRGQESHWLEALKTQSPVLGAAVVTTATIIIIKAMEFGWVLFLGFPLLIIEFAVFYLIGQKIQKRVGWEA